MATRPRPRPAASAAPICVTTWRSRSRTPITDKNANVRIPTSVTCEACSGSGVKAGTKRKPVRCAAATARCGTPRAFSRSNAPARNGHGRGQSIHARRIVRRLRRVTRERTLSVNIPPGVEDGTRIRLAGEGEPGPRRHGGRPRDLPVDRPAPLLQREGVARHCRVPVSMVRRAGRRFELRRSTAARPASKSRRARNLAAASAWRAKGCRCCAARQSGDMYVQVVVELRRLTKKQREL